MNRRILPTSDGSKTLYLADLDETYHSRHGAVREGEYVFICQGMHWHPGNPLRIVEMGLGTGLNALLTLREAVDRNRRVDYLSLEAFPCTAEEVVAMEYPSFLANETFSEATLTGWLDQIHGVPWGVPSAIQPQFNLTKLGMSVFDWQPTESADLVYFDAFGPRVQPELWEEPVLARFTGCLRPGGALVTYSARGAVRRTLEALGMRVERLPGPPGKREMLRAIRP